MSSTDSRLVKPDFRPGVNRQSASYASEGSWYNSNHIRFRSGNPESWRGSRPRVSTAFVGKGRQMLAWTDSNQNAQLAFGTECRVYLYRGDTANDITPIRTSVSLNNLFSVVSTSTGVVVSAAGHGIEAGSAVFITSATTVGGNVYLNGLYTATTVFSANSFGIISSVTAVATSAGAGAARLNFLLNCGASATTPGFGWGAGTWGHTGGWGAAADVAATNLQMRIWSHDLWGEDLVIAPRDGALYTWESTAVVSARAYLVGGAPSRIGSIVVSPEDRHLVALGTTDHVTSVYDPLLIRWSDEEDFTDWSPVVSNTAGDRRLGGGDRIIAGRRSRNQILVWTNDSLHGMAFSGPPFTFSFRQLGANCGLIGPNAAVDLNGIAYWMSAHNFHMYDGSVKYIPCNVQKYVFDRLNMDQADKVMAGTNQEQKEAIFLYCSNDSSEIDSYTLVDLDDGVWSIGSIDFTGWVDRGTFGNIITTQVSSFLYDHEIEDYYLVNGSVMPAFIESAEFDVVDGDDIVRSDRFIVDADLKGSDAAMDVYLFVRNYPGDDFIRKGPYTITSATRKTNIRMRGRRVKLLYCTPTALPNSHWEHGSFALNVQPDGKR